MLAALFFRVGQAAFDFTPCRLCLESVPSRQRCGVFVALGFRVVEAAFGLRAV